VPDERISEVHLLSKAQKKEVEEWSNSDESETELNNLFKAINESPSSKKQYPTRNQKHGRSEEEKVRIQPTKKLPHESILNHNSMSKLINLPETGEDELYTPRQNINLSRADLSLNNPF